MKSGLLPGLAMVAAMTLAAQAKMPAAKSASLTSPFGNAPLTQQQLQDLNAILAVSGPAPQPASAPTPTTTAKPSKLKPKKDKQPEKPQDRTIEVVDMDGKTSSLTVDSSAETFRNLKVPADSTAKVKALLVSLGLGKK